MRKLKKKKEKEMGVHLRERERDFEGDGQRLQFLTRVEFWGSLRDLRKFLHVSVWGFQYFSKRNLFLCLTKNL